MGLPDISFARSDLLWLLLAAPLIAAAGWWFGPRRKLRRPALALRTITVALIAVALAQPLTSSGGDATNTIFVVDRSRSVTEGSAGSVQGWVNAALGSAGGGAQAAVITFGSSPEVAASIEPANQIDPGWSEIGTVDSEYTDIETALALARALPVGGSRRIVLVSDGSENLGAALNQAGQAAADGTPIDVLVMPGAGGDDLRIEGASAPTAVWAGETVTVLASIASAGGGDGTIELIVDGASVATKAVTFAPGLSTFNFDVPDLIPGFHALAIRVDSTTAMDRYVENNVLPLSVVVRDAPKLLLVAAEGSDSGQLQGRFEREGALVTVVTPAEVSSRLSDLSAYDAFVLNDVAANAFTFDQLTGLKEATRTLGKGLIVVGGNGSFGPGNYAGTVLEETLPVTVKVTDGRERQKVALLLIIDKSGSMSYDAYGVNKIDMAKEAAKLAVGALADGDQIGILTFNDTQQWVVDMTVLEGQETRDQINAAIDTITADGGTEIFPALQTGFAKIRNTAVDVRHVVLLSDGKSRTGTTESYIEEIQDAVGDRTTLSTIAIGEDADSDLLAQLALEGKGRFHYTDRSDEIPQLTLQEARAPGSQSVIRGSFQPIQLIPSPIMSGFDPAQLPVLEGYDYAEAKPDAQVVLESARKDPLLAKWQFGLGRVVAWTGDDGTDYSRQWNEWVGLDDFWMNIIRWALPDPENRPINVAVTRDGPEAIINVSSVGQDGDYVDLARTTATITGPGGAIDADLPLYQSGPGQYQLRIEAPEAGAYEITLHQEIGGEVIEEQSSFTMPPSPELQPHNDGAALLSAIAARTGGRVLSMDDPGAAFAADGLTGEALRTYHPIWFWPVSLALVLFLFELAIRYDFVQRLRSLTAI